MALRSDLVSNTADGQDFRSGLRCNELLAEPEHMNVDSPLYRRQAVSCVQAVDELTAGENPSRSLHHRGKEAEFNMRECYGFPFDRHVMPRG
jgi:hypothetical protein